MRCRDSARAGCRPLASPSSLGCCATCRLTPAYVQNYRKMLWPSSIPTGNNFYGHNKQVVCMGDKLPVTAPRF